MPAVYVGDLPDHFVRDSANFALCVVGSPEPEEMHKGPEIERDIHRYLGVERAKKPRRFLCTFAPQRLGQLLQGLFVQVEAVGGVVD